MAMAVEERPRHSFVGTALPLTVAVAFSCFYLVVIAWSPGTSVPGSTAPFANPSLVPAAVLAVALMFALRRRFRVAQAFAVAGATIELVIGLLAGPLGWQGPSVPTAVFVAGLAALAAVPWRNRRAAITAAGVLLALVVILVVLETLALAYLQPYLPIAPVLPLLSVAVVVAVLVVAAAAWSVRRARTVTADR